MPDESGSLAPSENLGLLSPSGTGSGEPDLYKGWIPVVSGYLSYTMIGTSSYPTLAVSANIANDFHRYIVGYQRRPMLDSPFKMLSAAWLFVEGLLKDREVVSRDENLIFMVVARSNKKSLHRKLSGYIFVYREKTWKGFQESVVEFQKDIKKYDGIEGDGVKLGLKKILPAFILKSTEESLARVGFSVCRDGELSLRISKKKTQQSMGMDEKKKYKLASQVYYFIRDIVHRHQHHDPSSDQLTNIYKYDKQDELKWMRRTHYDLMRHIIRLKRSASISDAESSLGIMAYAKTLCDLLKRRENEMNANGNGAQRNNKNKNIFEIFMVDNLKSSIKAQGDVAKSKKNSVITWIASSISVFGAAVSIFAINIATMNMGRTTEIIVSQDYLNIAKWLVTHPVHFNSVILLVLFFSLRYARIITRNDDLEFRYARLASPLNRHFSIFIYLTTGISLIVTSVFLSHLLPDIIKWVDFESLWRQIIRVLESDSESV